jgi:hypothetical protein
LLDVLRKRIDHGAFVITLVGPQGPGCRPSILPACD